MGGCFKSITYTIPSPSLQIRKHSRTLQKGVGLAAVAAEKKPKNLATRHAPDGGETGSSGRGAEEELSNLRELLKLRDNEIGRLKREIHKLKVGNEFQSFNSFHSPTRFNLPRAECLATD